MKKLSLLSICAVLFIALTSESCSDDRPANTSVLDEQASTEVNQRRLLANQPLPKINWSAERDNLTKYTILQNDRTVNFFVYIYLEGVGLIGYYQVNKMSSLSSALTNPEQIVGGSSSSSSYGHVVSSPQLDGSYGTNGDGYFGFTPDGVMLATNMKFIESTIPLPVQAPLFGVITSEQAKKLLLNTQKVIEEGMSQKH